jgi:hypothetical protein
MHANNYYLKKQKNGNLLLILWHTVVSRNNEYFLNKSFFMPFFLPTETTFKVIFHFSPFSPLAHTAMRRGGGPMTSLNQSAFRNPRWRGFGCGRWLWGTSAGNTSPIINSCVRCEEISWSEWQSVEACMSRIQKWHNWQILTSFFNHYFVNISATLLSRNDNVSIGCIYHKNICSRRLSSLEISCGF